MACIIINPRLLKKTDYCRKSFNLGYLLQGLFGVTQASQPGGLFGTATNTSTGTAFGTGGTGLFGQTNTAFGTVGSVGFYSWLYYDKGISKKDLTLLNIGYNIWFDTDDN